jgi:DNA-binding FadR family transcriptional regulator
MARGPVRAAAPTADTEQNSSPSVPGLAFNLPRRASRAEDAAEAVEARINRQLLQPGTLLGTRRELGEMLAVAPSTVSEAIKLLEDRGRVVTRPGPGGGVFVAEPGARLRLARTLMQVSGSEGEVANALEVRDVLETAVIISAAERRPDATAAKPMLTALEALSEAADIPEFYRRNLEFHNEVAALASNEILGTIYRTLLELVRSHNPQLELLPGQSKTKVHTARVRAHEAIAYAIVAGDVDAARVAAAAHSKQGHAVVAPNTPS